MTNVNSNNAKNIKEYGLNNARDEDIMFNIDTSFGSFDRIKQKDCKDFGFEDLMPGAELTTSDIDMKRTSGPNNVDKTSYKHSFPRKFKENVVQYSKIYGINETCKKFKVTKKNIERWQLKGLERKKGAGRKTTNPQLELEMLDWVEDYIRNNKKLPKRKFIILQAKNFVSESFKASKGWCDKFLKRNKLRFARLIEETKEEML